MRMPKISLETKLKVCYIQIIVASILFSTFIIATIMEILFMPILLWFSIPSFILGFCSAYHLVDGLKDIPKFKKKIHEGKKTP